MRFSRSESPKNSSANKFSKIDRKKVILIVICLLVAVVAGVLMVVAKNRKPANKEPAKAPVVTYSTDKPDEKEPDQQYKWLGGATDPKKMKISSIGVDAFVQNVGVDQNKQVAVPNNVHLAGWFVDSVAPGNTGLSIIDGHVDGATQPNAVFRNLSKVKAGDNVDIEMGDGSIKTYEVFDIKTVKTEDAPSVLYNQDAKVAKQLNLITCIGTFDRASHSYDQRVIVMAKAKS